MAKRKGKSAKKNKHRQQGRAQQGQGQQGQQGREQQERERQTQGAGQQQARERGSGQSGRERRVATVKPRGRDAEPVSVTPEFVSQIPGMSDAWRAFYGAISQAVKEG